MVNLQPRPLFGGAISLPLPSEYLDASNMRQVPDNQEVFLSNASDTSVIVEILALVDEGESKTNLWEAAKYHFNSVAHDNSALEAKILTTPPPAPILATQNQLTPTTTTPAPVVLTGIQKIHKFSHDPTGAPRPGHEADKPDEVWIGLALWRVDLKGPNGAMKRSDVVCTVNVNFGAQGETERATVEEWWTRAVGQLKIVDYGLFADEQ